MGGTFAAAEKPLHDVIDHSGDPTLATKASALLMNNLAATRRYEDAFKLAQPLTIDLPFPEPDGPPPGAGEEAQPYLPDIGRPGSLQAGQRYPRPRHGPTPRTAVWSKREAPGFGDDGVDLREGVLQACFVLLALQEIGVLPMSISDPKDPSMPRHVRMLCCTTTPSAGNGDRRQVRPCPPDACRRHMSGCGGSRRATGATSADGRNDG